MTSIRESSSLKYVLEIAFFILFIYTLTILSFSIFVRLFFGDKKRTNQKGKKNKRISITSVILRFLKKLCDIFYITELFNRIYSYVLIKRNPKIKLVFYIIITGNLIGFFFLLNKEISQFPEQFPPIYKVFGFSMVVCSYILFLYVSHSNPGYINKGNYQRIYEAFQFDEVCYSPGNICKTCGIEKPARSKHCRFRGKCVSRYDHYCPWLGNTIGEYNYRWFQLLLTVVLFTTSFGTFVYLKFLFTVSTNYIRLTNSTKVEVVFALLKFLHGQYFWIIVQTIELVGVTLFLCLFKGFHLLKLLLPGTTTAELIKWRKLRRQLSEIQKNKNDFIQIKGLSNQQIQSLQELNKRGETVHNIYDKGFFSNIKEVIFPLSKYTNTRTSKSRKE